LTSEIQFGDLQHTQPKSALRPDQDAHFLVTTVGQVGDHELPIYVDLDVMRDMEAHARTNTEVELGGVMLGQQSIDGDGRPFVWISDCLRARHYEATKGSFKFTHDTWSQITRERQQYRPDLEMIGWYHTHPGWSVFLSGMDLFICNHFFNRPLDVALVIDPVADDRGWFQWTAAEKPVTRKTGGFYLTTNRFRNQELDFFSRRYNRQPLKIPDPRYRTTDSGNSSTVPGLSWLDGEDRYPHGGLSMENRRDQTMASMNGRNVWYDIAFLTMFPMTILALALIAWKLLTLPTVATLSPPAQPIAASDNDVETAGKAATAQALLAREKVWREVLGRVVESQTGETDLAEDLVNLKSENDQLKSNLIAQQALAEKLNRQRDEAQKFAESTRQELETKSKLAEQLQSQLLSARSSLTQVKSSSRKTNPESRKNSATPEPAATVTPWWWLAIGGVACALVGGAIGFVASRNPA
jgi:proteasome lid subunit RPN8/RPN11